MKSGLLRIVLLLGLAVGFAGCAQMLGDDAGTPPGACACSESEYCDRPVGECSAPKSVCQPRPDACAMVYAPVCGCDGQTYSNACHAAAAGTSVASAGECP